MFHGVWWELRPPSLPVRLRPPLIADYSADHRQNTDSPLSKTDIGESFFRWFFISAAPLSFLKLGRIMKLIKSGKKGLLSKVSYIISFVWKNCKLELLIILLGILWMNLSWRIPGADQTLAGYFSESRYSGIAGFASVVIGIYALHRRLFKCSSKKLLSFSKGITSARS